MPVAEGVPLAIQFDSLSYASKAIHRQIQLLLEQHAVIIRQGKKQSFKSVKIKLSEDTLEDIKVRCCFISPFTRAQTYAKNKYIPDESSESFKEASSIDYPLDGMMIIRIPGIVREFACEVLFEQDIDGRSIATLILDTLLQSSIDLRQQLAKNILVIGGTAMIPGFLHRLHSELIYLVNISTYVNRLVIKQFHFHSPPAQLNYTAWLGGSIFGTLDILESQSIICDKYLENGIIPDCKYSLKAISDYLGGIHNDLRSQAWKYLFGFYPPLLSKAEQETIDIERKLRYDFMCERCQQEMPQELCSQLPHLSSNKLKELLSSNQIFFSIQQRIEAYKPKFNWYDMDYHVRLIAKDLHRTDFISSEKKPVDYNYGPLTRLLVTFACYNPTIGYSQGMNDMALSFLHVFSYSEHEAYFCFASYIIQSGEHFTKLGIATKIKQLPKLVEIVDQLLYDRIVSLDVELWTFCHRWLFLCFRREFAKEEDTLICFEVVSSHFLEENSLAGERLLYDIQLKQAEQIGISSYSSISTELNSKHNEDYRYSFDLFVCIAMISLFRSCLFDAHDELEALEAIQQRQKTLDVRQVLSLAEQLFKIYYQQITAMSSTSSMESASFEII
ncbi:unnamed protein product [Rotaria sordida]|uniref:Rab-GAP TBC domain-containing protein n=1 Tax=Rotaria sordida TaxID=392033 RepID=A0A814G5Y2_9BILA|nr:unnamed protein product [Rotaria sordida]CAF0991734.1 unnamed protein product [Rotaria sordida]